MKVAVSAYNASLDSGVDPRFGRCPYLILVDTDTLEYEPLENPSASASGGAGIQAARFVAEKGVEAVITGNIGPNAQDVLSSAGIRIFTGASGTVREVIQRVKNGRLKNDWKPGGAGETGMGKGMAGGPGRRMGGGGRSGGPL